MISKEILNIDWINQVSVKNRNADKILIEKVIRALLLLEGLSESELTFVFKGGTAVMILQGIPRRFSIDIDIIVPSKIQFEDIFEKFLSDKNFTKAKLHERKASSSNEKLHYKFLYNPVSYSHIEEDNILLDILIESDKYEKILEKAVDSPFVKQEGPPLQVRIPSFEDILGDKLTAFAPNTTGIPYVKNSNSMGMEIIKQLYDIGNLFEEAQEISRISKTFGKIAETEMKYRELSGSTGSVLDDITQTALCISTRGQAGKGNFDILQKGISQLKTYIFSELYHIEKAVVHASRTAYLAKLLMYEETQIVRYKNPLQVLDWSIENPVINKLNKLKKSNPEAFFYWYQAYLLEKKSKDV